MLTQLELGALLAQVLVLAQNLEGLISIRMIFIDGIRPRLVRATICDTHWHALFPKLTHPSCVQVVALLLIALLLSQLHCITSLRRLINLIAHILVYNGY
ncbi:hypothetical protein BJ138DRAFT_1160961 [Hygrophoropsis aurantiaca]|uniref:Uncharacterized protein n=1 Tax=Hygrophoropsis aurantiaca TaxID=72124 RepID=A0ACB8A375_9AGAM|nr:hypothetical protein BJ138DRAFT_1160961 [Hygrophoropsis aurantiaca]